ncbi:hypothetical protein ACFFRR_004810 [Megaselia abdita]
MSSSSSKRYIVLMFQELIELFFTANPFAFLFRPEVVWVPSASSIEEIPATALVLVEIVSDELSSTESSLRRQIAYTSWKRTFTTVLFKKLQQNTTALPYLHSGDSVNLH